MALADQPWGTPNRGRPSDLSTAGTPNRVVCMDISVTYTERMLSACCPTISGSHFLCCLFAFALFCSYFHRLSAFSLLPVTDNNSPNVLLCCLQTATGGPWAAMATPQPRKSSLAMMPEHNPTSEESE